MPLAKFNIPPQQASYSFQDGQEVLSVQLDGGVSRYRKDIEGAAFRVDVRWLFDQTQFNVFRAFYRSTTLKGSQPFLIDLILDEAALVEYEVNFIVNSVRMPTLSGLSLQVSGQLEVKPLPFDVADDLALVALYDEYGEELPAFLNQLEQLANVDFNDNLS